MNTSVLNERLFDALILGDRDASRRVVEQAILSGLTADELLTDVFWQTYSVVEQSFRADKIARINYQAATRLLRVLCDRVAATLDRQPGNGRSIFAVCGPTDADELAAQIASDLLEREGFDVCYVGGGIAGDEILEKINRDQPDVLVLFASAPCDLPDIRAMIDTLNEIGASRKTQIVCGGGVFNRAKGLAEEIGADLWAEDPEELVEAILDEPERRMSQSQRTVGKTKLPHAKAA